MQLSLLKYSQGEHLNARAFLQRYLRTNPASASVLYLGVQIEDELGDDERREVRVCESDYCGSFPPRRKRRRILDAG